MPDGQIELEGNAFGRPSAAAGFLTGRPTNGWSFFYVDPKTKTSLRKVRSEYLESLDIDLEGDEDDEQDDDDDE